MLSLDEVKRRIVALVSIEYTTRPDERPFLSRAQTREQAGIEVTVAALSDYESKRFFGVRIARRGMQAVWLQITNHTSQPVRLDFFSIDPTYYTPLEASYINHYSLGKRLVSFGFLALIYLWLLPLVPFKILGARRANRRMDAFFKQQGFRPGPIDAGENRAGFVYTQFDEGVKNVDVRVVATDGLHEFGFSLEVPGLKLAPVEGEPAMGALEEVDVPSFRQWIAKQARCTANKRGTLEGDPLNLIVIGDRTLVLQCFGARWDEAEAITLSTCWKTAKAFVFDSEYRYSPVSSLFVDGRRQDLALQKIRSSINERIHLRLWRTHLAYQNEPIWIGQVSRDIGVRFTWKTWNLTTHRIDPDVDEARDYVIDYLMSAHRVALAGYVDGVGAATPTAPRHNLTGDPYFTDGNRAVVVLSRARSEAKFLSRS
jgi:hypothetical protein